jgi:hypothetical protein
MPTYCVSRYPWMLSKPPPAETTGLHPAEGCRGVADDAEPSRSDGVFASTDEFVARAESVLVTPQSDRNE